MRYDTLSPIAPPPLIPDGEYVVVVHESTEETLSSKGTRMVRWALKIKEGSHSGRLVTEWISAAPGSRWFMMQALNAMQTAYATAEDAEIDFESFIGDQLRVVVTKKPDRDGVVQNRIKRFLPLVAKPKPAAAEAPDKPDDENDPVPF